MVFQWIYNFFKDDEKEEKSPLMTRLFGKTCEVCTEEYSITSRFVRLKCCGKSLCTTCFERWLLAQFDDTKTLQKITFTCPFCSVELSDKLLSKLATLGTYGKIQDLRSRLLLIRTEDFLFCPKCPSGGFIALHDDDLVCKMRVFIGVVALNASRLAMPLYLQHLIYPNIALIMLTVMGITYHSITRSVLSKTDLLTNIALYGGNVTCNDCAYAWRLSPTKDSSMMDNKEWIQKHTKACPKCQTPIQKRGGCEHMYCVNCKHNFCWKCLQSWNMRNIIGHRCGQATTGMVEDGRATPRLFGPQGDEMPQLHDLSLIAVKMMLAFRLAVAMNAIALSLYRVGVNWCAFYHCFVLGLVYRGFFFVGYLWLGQETLHNLQDEPPLIH